MMKCVERAVVTIIKDGNGIMVEEDIYFVGNDSK